MPPSWIFCRRIPFLNTSLYLHKFPIFAAHNNNISLVSFSTSAPKISLLDYLVNHHHFSPECAAKVSSFSSPKCLNNPQNAVSVLNFLDEIGVPNNHIQAIVKRTPGFLSAHLHSTIKPKFKLFQDLGFRSSDFAHLISTCPWLLHSSTHRLSLSILGLKNVLGPNADICSLLKNSASGRFLGYDFSRTVVPNIHFLKTCGICSLQIAWYVSRYPSFFLTKPEKLKGVVQRADEMGVDRNRKMFIEAVRVMSNMTRESWQLKLDVFRELGFSEHDICVAFRRMPPVFCSSHAKIKEVTELLLTVEDISYIANNPVLLGYSVEKRLKPRLRVLKALQTKNLLKKNPSLSQVLKMSDAEFIEKYVNAFSNEVGGLYAAS
ncbi:Mitochondrial transcription termination factor family protein [Euphorbia peplus]|nr:Mitochondrial transcription termination factor family protein [Euphorbia peplus]